MNFFISVFLFLFLSVVYAPTFAKTAPSTFQGMLINADVMEREAQTLELKGNVQIIFKNQHLSAQKATIYQSQKKFVAEGDVEFITTKATLGGDKIEMNYETNIGTLYHGYIQSGQVFFEGEVIEKTGEETFNTIKSEYTSCTTCPASWSFSGSSIDAELGGYAIIKNSLLKIGAVPVLWLPYLVVPLKSTRQTGLLTPNIDYSDKGGLAISQPLFWAISPSEDATFTLKNYARRGLKSQANYRYQLTNESYGELDFNTIEDHVFVDDDRLKTFRGPNADPHLRRWYLKYKHYWVLPNDWIQRIDLNSSSDLQYSTDFPEESLNHGDNAMENRVSLTKNTSNFHFSIDNSYYINLLKSNPLGDNTGSVHRLPEIHLTSTKRNLFESGLLFDYDIQYTNFYRSDFAYDDIVSGVLSDGKTSARTVNNSCSTFNPSWDRLNNCTLQRDGKFNSGTDLIRSGQRLIIEPTLTYPMQFGSFFDVIPKLNYQESHYSFGTEEVSNLSRRALRTEIKLQTNFSKIYGDSSELNSMRYKHEIQPEIISNSIPWLDQPLHPFLGFKQINESNTFKYQAVSDKDFYGDNGIQFDYNDRLYDRNILTYRLTNKITRKSWSGNTAIYEPLMLWRLSQSYDLYQAAHLANPKPFSDLESLLNLRLAHFNTYTKLNYFPYQKITDASSRVSVNDDIGNFFQVGLSKKYIIAEDGSYNNDDRTEDYEFILGTSAKYVNFIGRVVYDGNSQSSIARQSRFKSWTYTFILKPPGNCWSIYFIQDHVVGGDTNYHFQFDFLFDGKNSTQISKDSLNKYGI